MFIPMVVTTVQDYPATGQFAASGAGDAVPKPRVQRALIRRSGAERSEMKLRTNEIGK
jgi:hypothetical protein